MFICGPCHIILYNLGARDSHMALSLGQCERCKGYMVCVNCPGHGEQNEMVSTATNEARV